MTAWDGAAYSAPFHGFAIFLDSSEQSCIIFEIHIRVEDGDPSLHKLAGNNPVPLGHATGWQSRTAGLVNGQEMENLNLGFSNRSRPGEIDDGSVDLITPRAGSEAAIRSYRDFVGHLRFWR